MIKDRLKDVEIRLTDLAEYLQISRPTMYKFIEYYDDGEYSLINKKVKKLFDYITDNKLAGKNNVINYIMTNLVEVDELGEKKEDSFHKKLKSFVVENSESSKVLLIKELISKQKFNYMADMVVILNDKEHEKFEEANQIMKQIKKLIESTEE